MSNVLQHVPFWVWGLLVGLSWLGLKQTFPRQVSLGRVTLMPVAMLVLSFTGVTGSFGRGPAAGVALLAWAMGLAAAMLLVRIEPRGVRFDAATRRFQVPGSWWPLALIWMIFVLKFATGMALAIQPALAADALVAGGLSGVFGAFSGVFLARAWPLWRMARNRMQQAFDAAA